MKERMGKSVKERDSNIELLRVVAIFLVMVVHSIGLNGGIGMPTSEVIGCFSSSAIVRIFCYSLSIICVDVFVIISGWYGIHASLRGLFKLMFMCFFFGMIGLCCSIWCGETIQSLSSVIKAFVESFFPCWFIAAYIVMYLLSPAINAFVEKCSERCVRNVLIVLFSLEFIYGWLFPEGGGSTFQQGYSADSLILLYALAKYLRIHVFDDRMMCSHFSVFSGGCMHWLVVWMGLVFVDVVIYAVTSYLGIGQIGSRVFVYTSPIVIMQSVAMFMFFKNVRMRSRFINWLGASSLAALFVHGFCSAKPFLHMCVKIYSSYGGVQCLLLLLAFMSAIFLVAVLLDQPRLWLWNRVSRAVPNVRFYD